MKEQSRPLTPEEHTTYASQLPIEDFGDSPPPPAAGQRPVGLVGDQVGATCVEIT